MKYLSLDVSRKKMIEALVKLPSPFGKDVADCVLANSTPKNRFEVASFCKEIHNILGKHFIIEFRMQLIQCFQNSISKSLENEMEFKEAFLLGPLLKENILSNEEVNRMIQIILIHGTFDDLDFRSELLFRVFESCGEFLTTQQKKYFHVIIEGLSAQTSGETKLNLQEILKIIQYEKKRKAIIFKGAENETLKSYYRNIY
jgi:hypothetical protein